jgi:hypothetical protein
MAAVARVTTQLESGGVKKSAAAVAGNRTPDIRAQECQIAVRMVLSFRKGTNKTQSRRRCARCKLVVDKYSNYFRFRATRFYGFVPHVSFILRNLKKLKFIDSNKSFAQEY